MKRSRIRELSQVVDLAVDRALACGIALTEDNVRDQIRSAAQSLRVKLRKRLRQVCSGAALHRYERRAAELRQVA